MKKLMLLGVFALFASLCFTTEIKAQVEVHGFMQARTVVANNDYGSRMDRWGFRLQQKIDDEFDWLTEIYVHPFPATSSPVYMESAYLNWHMKNYVPWDFTVRIGKGRNETYGQAPYYSKRRTTDYTLYSEAFTQSRVQGFQTFSNFGKVQLAVGILNPFIPGKGRAVPDFPTGDSIQVPIGDAENADNATDRVALSGRLGYKTSILNVGVSAYISELGPMDDNDLTRFGADGELKLPCGFISQAQFTVAKTGTIDHNGGEIMAGWESAKYGFYGRYGMLSFDDKLQGMNQIMVSALYKIRPTVHLRLEALINGEDEDAAKKWVKKDNDVLFFETMFAW